MTAAEAYKEIKALRGNKKRKLSEPQKRALDYAMVVIAQGIVEELVAVDE